MSNVSISPGARAIPERLGWTLRVLLVAAIIFAVGGVITLVVQVLQLITWAQPDARVPVSMDVSYVLPTNHLRNDYSGIPFVRDGTAVTAEQVSTTLDHVPLLNRLLMGAAPVLWTLTGLLVAVLLVVAIRRLLAGAAFGRDSARPVEVAAAVVAIGGSFAQVAQGASTIGFGAFDWAAPNAADVTLIRTIGFTFEFTPLLVACGLLAVSLILRRGLALQREVDGLI